MSQSVEAISSPTFEQPAHSGVVEMRELDNGMFGYKIDGDATRPTVEAYTSSTEHTAVDARRFYIDENVYGVTNEDGRLFKDNADDQPDYAKRSAIGVRNYIGRQSTKNTQAPLLIRAKDGFAYRDSPDSLVGILLRKADGSTRRLYQDPDDATKVSKISTYTPEAGDQLLMGNRQLLDFAAAHSQEYKEVLKAMREKNASFMNIVCEDEYITGITAVATQNLRRENFRNMRAREEERAKAEAKQADNTPGSAAPDSTMSADEAQAAIDAARGFSVTDKRHHASGKEVELDAGHAATSTNTPTMSLDSAPTTAMSNLDNAMRLARHVEKYTSKVDEYETLAAAALAKRMKGKLFKSLRKSSKEADEEFERTTHFLDGFTMALDNALMKQWTAEGYTDAEVAEMIYEHQQLREARRHDLNHQRMVEGDSKEYEGQTGLKAKWSRLKLHGRKSMEWYANQGTVTKIGLGVVAVAAVGGLGALAGAGLGAAGAVGLAGAKVGKTYAQQRSKVYKKVQGTTLPPPPDARTLSDSRTFAIGSDGEANELTARYYVTAAKEHAKTEREKAVKKADRDKKIAIGVTALSAVLLGVGAAAEHSGAVQDALAHARGWFGHPLHNDILPSQGGGSIHNPIDKLGSGDVYTPPKVTVPLPGHDAFVPQDLGGATEFKGAGLDHFNQWVSGHTVQPGESVWKLSQDYLQANGVQNPSVFQIDAVKDSVLAEFSAKGLVDSNGWLSAGELLNLK